MSTTLQVSDDSSRPDWLKSAIAPYQSQSFNLLLPSVPVNSELGFALKPKLSIVKVDTDPDHQEIYKVGGRNGQDVYSLGKVALEKLASAAGIQFKTSRVDDRKNSDYCEVECVGVMKNESGTVIRHQRTKAFNMPDVRAESLAQRMKWKKPGQDVSAIEADVDREMASFKKHILARTETGAINRVMRGLLALRSQWTKAELEKPFVLMRIDFQPDASDPDVKRYLLQQGDQAARALYAEPQATQSLAIEVEDDDEPEFPATDEGAANGDERSPAPATGAAAPLSPAADIAHARRACFAAFNEGIADGRILVGKTDDERRAYLCELMERPVASRVGWTLEDWAEARRRLMAARPKPTTAETDYLAEITAGRDNLGLTQADMNKLFAQHGGDLPKIHAAIQAIANERNAA